jgi:phosphopantothenoylcysteine decarboxylase / phosphopantothenate---cysteine ligase
VEKQNIILCITGSIAAQKAAMLASILLESFNVKIILSKAAENFVSKNDFKKLNITVYTNNELYDDEMLHIHLAKEADIILIAPATANIIAKIANGFADCLISTVCLATNAIIKISPAMNQQMWSNSFVQENVEKLEQNGVEIIGPAFGQQACGDVGYGRMLEPKEIADHLILKPLPQRFIGKKVCITAGGTIEKIDPVRYISNFSSGKMGYELADAAQKLGAKIDLILANSNVKITNSNINVIRVESADEMYKAAQESLKDSDIFIGAAAVADYKVKEQSKQKIKKSDESINIPLIKNIDIISTLRSEFPKVFFIGFAAETENLLENSKAKLEKKNLDMLIANDVSDGKVFNSDESEVYILTKNSSVEHIESSSKQDIAQRILEHLNNLKT